MNCERRVTERRKQNIGNPNDPRATWETSPLRGLATDHRFMTNQYNDNCAVCGLKHTKHSARGE